MPLKTCPKCDAQHGTRKQACDCGYAFNKHPLTPEPGGWVLDTYKGLPEIEPPDPLPPGKLDAVTVKQHVDYEGLGFCIYHLIPAEWIKDRRLKKLWADARTALGKVEEYLDES